MHSGRSRFTIGILIVLCLALACFGQVAGRISGTVLDATGASIPDAKVKISIAGTVIAETVTTKEGLFGFSGLRAENYDIRVDATGFTPEILTAVKVDAARDTSVPPITLNPGSVSSTVEVSAAVTTIQTSNAELSTTVTKEQIAALPQLNRSPLALISTVAGVGSNGRENTTINGLRTSYTNITVDGVNVQDNYIRTNALDFLPNLLLLDQIAEMTITTSNGGASIGGAAAQVSFVTPSGTNAFHGSLYWYNRNNALAANSWFNNRDKINLPFLNQNQAGGTLGGRIIKDKLFFYTNYEAFRLRQQTTSNRTILTDDARNGIFTYADSSNVVRKVNLPQLTGKTIDPAMKALIGQLPPASVINQFRQGDSLDAANLRNTAGYSFVNRSNRDRNNLSAKIDYMISSKLSATGLIQWNGDRLDRPNLSTNYLGSVPVISNDNKVWLGSYSIRWSPTSSLTNEARGGYNLAPGVFASSQKNPDYLVGGLIFSNPLETFLPQGRYTDTYNLADNASWVKGKHKIDFGFQAQLTRVFTYNDAGIVPTYNLGIGSGQTANSLTAAMLPGIKSADLTTANSLQANLFGYLNSASTTFNVKDRTSGFVSNQSDAKNLSFDTYAFYFQDNYKVSRKLTVQAGVRHEYFTRVNERDSLYLTPVIANNNVIQTMLSNATLDFGGNSVGRPYYNKDLNNFAPNIGMAYTPFQDGKTVFRAGYSVNFVNDNLFRAIANAVGTSAGLSQAVSITALTGTLSGNRPAIPTPAYKVPRTLLDNYNLNPGAAMATIDPDLRTPYVQQWNFSIQREVKGGILDVRYVGNKGTKLLRGSDLNQVNINTAGFLADFKRASANGLAAVAAGGTFNPAYNAAIPGSQPLTVFPLIGSGGSLANATVLAYIQQQQVGELANYYQSSALLTGPRSTSAISFYPNPYGLGMNLTMNQSNASYNALQIDYSRRFTRGLQFQINYSYSKSLSDTLGNGQTNFEALLDANNGKLERARTPFDQTHALKSNAVYELPFGKGKRFAGGSSPIVSRLVGGWSISGIYTLNTGNPFSMLSQRGTLNRAARSTGTNTATTTLNKGQLDDLMGLYFTGGGPYFVAQSAIGKDGRGVAADGAAPFSGQAFTNPTAGNLGVLQRRMFSGPTWYNLDFGIQKKTQITERQSLELRFESTNVTNHATFYYSDEDINSTSFGKVAGAQTSPRRVQIGLYYRF